MIRRLSTRTLLISPKQWKPQRHRLQMLKMVCFRAHYSGNDADAYKVYLKSSAARSIDDTDYTNPMLCPPFTLGYALDRKVWCRFFIDNLESINWLPDPMDSLILPNTQKRILRALVHSHIFPAQARDEWGLKGKGLVVLLHGTPGSGKTLTAGVLVIIAPQGQLLI